MYRWPVTYKDFDGKEVIEDFYFNLTKAEMAEMQLSTQGGMKEYFEVIIEKNDMPAVIAAFKNILLASVGKRSADGKLFIKNKEVVESFQFSGAYDVVFMRLISDAKKASEFVNGVMPEDMVKAVGGMNIDLPQTATPAPNLSAPSISQVEMMAAMNNPEVQAFIQRQQQKQNPLGL